LSLQNPNNQQITDYTANQYGSLAWFYLFTKQFKAAETSAEKALDLSKETEWVNTNLALALLYQGKYKEAEAIYLRLKDKEYGEATYRETFLKDLEELEAAGVTHKDVKKVRRLLD
ncbi:MAG: tetratricopeptide repeat protein, partial [Bacteroidota bacterium]